MRAEIKQRIEQIEQGILPKGYKETKVGIIPEEWEVKKLEKTSEIVMGNSPNSENYNEEKFGLPLIQGNADCENRKINPRIYTKEITKESYSGDIIMTVRAPVGAISLSNIHSCIGRGVCAIRCKNIFTKFLYNQLINYESKWGKYSQGSTFTAVNSSEIRKLELPFPPLEEQEKIAFILTQWESLIEEQEKLIEEKSESFKIITNELINKKKRFPEFKENWKNLKLQEFVTPVVREVKKPNEPYEALGIRSHCKGTFHKFVENPEEVGMDSLYKVKADDLIVNITFAWEHAIAIANSEDEGRLVSHRFPTYEIKKEKIDLQFLRALIRQPRLKYMLGLISPGGAGRNRVLNKKDFLKLEFNLPPLEEQQKIGEFLSKLNEEILLHQYKLNLLREEKKILMQLLLTGIIRV